MPFRRVALPLGAFAVVVLAGGAVHGVFTNRWADSDALRRSVAALDGVPPTVGEWTSAPVPHEADDLARVGIRGNVFRTYRNDRTGATVSVLLVCGRGGPISVHTPDVCYAGSGFRQIAPQARMSTGDDRSAFWAAPFDKPDPLVPQRLTVAWAWSEDGSTWVAPDSPRAVCAWRPALYKMYVVHNVPANATGPDPVVADFLADFLPRVRSALAPTS